MTDRIEHDDDGGGDQEHEAAAIVAREVSVAEYPEALKLTPGHVYVFQPTADPASAFVARLEVRPGTPTEAMVLIRDGGSTSTVSTLDNFHEVRNPTTAELADFDPEAASPADTWWG